MSKKILNSQNVIDSRDVEERISQLEDEAEDPEGLDEDDADELKALIALREDCGSSEWKDGVGLIRGTYFMEYAQELAEDIGAIPKDAGWPSRCIDWDQAADELLVDYSSCEFDGVTYYYRS